MEYAPYQDTSHKKPANNNEEAASLAENNPEAFRSTHTNSFHQLLKELRCSLLVSTYQAGKLIIVRESEGSLNTHFRVFNKPMGMRADKSRIDLGTQNEIIEFRNIPAAASKIEPKGKHDACFIASNSHTTGDIDIHEMARDDQGRLWFINTRFSCLCTLDPNYSFSPQWRPPFISHYSPEDRCHLNGLGMREGKPRYVTALGSSNKKGGWRKNKAKGGILMDIQNNRVIAQGLSMPHSPRFYGKQLWVLESGNGSIARVDEETGELSTLCVLPGFTRGIDFVGELAFVGLSQVRESAVFSGIPITERVPENERCCGVWVVNLRSGEILAFLKFEGIVQEIFSVEIIPDTLFPELLEPNDPLINSSYVLPDNALKDVKMPQKDKK